jgi:hypothetical protein
MSYLENATGTQGSGTSGNGGGFFSNVGGLIAGILLFTCFWPLLVPFYGTGQNFTKESPLNYILEVAWIVFVIAAIRALHRKHRNRL